MRFKKYLNEKVTTAAAQKKAKDRFWSFEKKAKDQDHLSRMINARTQKTTDPEKLKAWYEYLEDQNFHDEAELAYRKWKQMSESVNESSMSDWWDKNAESFKDMLPNQNQRDMMPNHFWNPAYFQILKPVKAYIRGDFEPTNAYYGNAQIHQRTSKEITLKKGDEIHWIPGGHFLVRGNDVYRLSWDKPKGAFEKSYGGDMSDHFYKSLMFSGKIKLIHYSKKKNVRYPSG